MTSSKALKTAAYNREFDKMKDELLPSNCVRCGGWVDRHNGTLHHRLSRGKGGLNTRENLAPVTHECHDYIEKHPAESYKNGWSIPKYKKG